MNKKAVTKNKELLEAICSLKNAKEIGAFMRDLLTEQEIIEFGNRWKAAQMLYTKIPYSQIAKETGLSSTTIARVSKWLLKGKGGYRMALEKANKKNKNQKTLIIIATHGDEKIGFKVVKNLQKLGLSNEFDFIVGNPKAFRKSKRFIEVDLNRSYPGDKNSPIYEKRLAYENLQIAKKYRWIIDIHEADQGKDDFIIIPRKKMNCFPIKKIDLQKVLLWPNPKGPLGQVTDNEVELEFGVKNRDRKELEQKATLTVKDFLLGKKSNDKKEIYRVYGKLLSKDCKIKINKLVDFQEIKINKERFCPLLVGQYANLGIACYKMRKII